MSNSFSKKFKSMIAGAALVSSSAAALDFNLVIDDPSQFQGVQGELALNGFQAAADFWSALLTDDVTVNLSIGFAALEPNVIAQAGSERAVFIYNDIINAMANDASSAVDSIAVNNLSCRDQGVGVCALQFLDQEADTGAQELDNDGSADNYALAITQANAKALGFNTNSWGDAFAATDAGITFSSEFAFDFDPTDGIDGDKMDFIGVAIHEIGHSLGFTSSVDIYDFVYNELDPPFDVDGFAMLTALDLFRYSDESLTYGAGTLDMRPGADSYFSIDGGATNLGGFSTGSFGGDGRQASHWKDNLGLGLMDPTIGFSELGQVSILDVVAMDAIGWDITTAQVPEPAAITLFGLSFASLMFARRRKSIL